MIHPSAIVDPGAELDAGVEVGPYCVIGAEVRIASGTRVGPHAVINGPTDIGHDNRIFQFASVGEEPQDKKYAGERTRLVIGNRNRIREFATVHRGTIQDRGETSIGHDNLLMAYTHVAHDCCIGNNVILANAASLGGHVHVDDYAILGGFTIVHQFCQIGAHCFSAMGSVVTRDVPPFITVGGHPAEPRGLNGEGLKRRAFDDSAIAALKRAYRFLYLGNRRQEDALALMREDAGEWPEVDAFIRFIEGSTRSIVR